MVFLYAMLGVLCLGIAPLFGKTALTNVSPMFAFAIRTIIAALLAIVWLTYTNYNEHITKLPLSFWIAISVEAALAAFFGDLAYFYALQKGNIGEVSLILSCAPLVTIVLTHFFYHEPVNLIQIIGAILITSGLLLLCTE
ncbi:MAG: EamA-like transporter family protein [Firmicutes bacterium]|nr:EamA-like transporter family protein [Bacillota bacterium]